MFDIKKIEKMIKKDFHITRENLKSKIYTIPNIHSKYLRNFFYISKIVIDLETEKDLLYIKKRNYYLNDYPEIIRPTQVDFYIRGDKEYAELSNKLATRKLELKIIEDALNRCATISYFVKNIIDYENFLVGQ